MKIFEIHQAHKYLVPFFLPISCDGCFGHKNVYVLLFFRFGRSSMYHKKAIYKFVKNKAPKKVAKKTAVFVEKKIKGDKNGGTRSVTRN